MYDYDEIGDKLVSSITFSDTLYMCSIIGNFLDQISTNQIDEWVKGIALRGLFIYFIIHVLHFPSQSINGLFMVFGISWTTHHPTR